jgi:hypothetical protein
MINLFVSLKFLYWICQKTTKSLTINISNRNAIYAMIFRNKVTLNIIYKILF